MAKKQSETISEEMEALRAEITVITEKEDASDDEIARADTLLDEWKTKDVDLKKAQAREEAVAEVMRARLASPANREGGDVRRAAEVIRKRDPFEADPEFVELMRSVDRGAPGGNVVNFDPATTIDRARRAVDEVPKWAGDKTRERLHELLDREDETNTPLIARHILITGSPEYRKQFKEHVRSGGRFIPELIRTAMSLTSGNGGVLVPHYLDPTIILTNAGVYGGTIRSMSTVKTIATKQWEGVTSAGVSAAWTAEASSATDGSPTFVSPTIVAQKASAWITGSYEVFEDSGFSADLGLLLADAKSRLEEAAFATGNTGASVPRGVLAAVQAVTASIVTSATTGAFVVGDVHNTSNAVNPRQENNLAWLAHKAIYSKIRQFSTAGGGAFWSDMNLGQPANLLGAPAMKSASMTSAVANGANVLLCGDFSQYYIIDRIGMTVIYDPLVKTTAAGAAPTGQAGWYAHWRVGADVVNADAFRLLQLNQVAANTALA